MFTKASTDHDVNLKLQAPYEDTSRCAENILVFFQMIDKQKIITKYPFLGYITSM